MKNTELENRRRSLGLGLFLIAASALLVLGLTAGPAFAVDTNEVEAKKFGYTIEIPKDFKRQGVIDKTTSWMRHKAGGDTSGKSKKKKRKIGGSIRIRGVGLSGSREDSDSSSSSGSSESEPALNIYVNWTYMGDEDSKKMFELIMADMQKKIDAPNSDYTDLEVLKLKDGYGFWYKEEDKHSNDDLHRWHIQAWGNKSSYTVGLTGTFGQFEEWGAVYKDVIASFDLIPLKD